MDFTSSLKSEIFRPFAILLIPGSFAIFPYIFVCWHTYPKAVILAEKYPGLAFAFFLIAVVAVGLFLEDLGSLVEASIYDKILRMRVGPR